MFVVLPFFLADMIFENVDNNKHLTTHLLTLGL